MLSALHMQFPPEKFVETLKLMEHRYGAKAFVMSKDCSLLASGTYYLTEVDLCTGDSMPRNLGMATTLILCLHVRMVPPAIVADPVPISLLKISLLKLLAKMKKVFC